MILQACLFVIMAGLIVTPEAAKILMVPGNLNSHTLSFAALGEELSQAGHHVQILMPLNNKMVDVITQNDNFTITRYHVDDDIPFFNSRECSETMIKIALTDSVWTKLELWSNMEEIYTPIYEKECESLMENKKVIRGLKESGFQFAIMDPWIAPGCNFLIPKLLSIPYGIFTPSVTWNSDMARVPRLPSFFPFISMGTTDEMSFFQRLLSFLLNSAAHLKYTLSKSEQHFIQKYYDPNAISSYHEIMANASVWFFLEDIALNFPAPNMPNTLSIGDARRPVKPLSTELESFLHETQEMAILVSFGSFFDFVPEFLARSFCNVFRQLKHQVIWKLKNATYCDDVKNVKVMDWIPQNDILAHSKIRLFITHGGYNSMVESVFHAKPMIIFPVAYDQPNNAAVAIKRGFGIRMDMSNLKAEDLIGNIDKIFRDPSYTDNARKASAILKDKPEGAGERASFLINHLIKHGDSHLKTGAHSLSLFQYYMFDIILFIGAFNVCICLDFNDLYLVFYVDMSPVVWHWQAN